MACKIVVNMSFESDIYWLDEELRRIQSSIMEPVREYPNQGRHGSNRVKRQTEVQAKDLSCGSDDERQNAGITLSRTLDTDHKDK
ncbi:hypothetical protein LCGC14_1236530 [marine sediment metagenome]|uniref:Uncharacterized protein n=1 Tax=marine sediment metagenome TaxID=412755 RepID=A0A0F9LU56_9ZZZZ